MSPLAKDVTTTLEGVPHGPLSKRCICYPNMVIITPLKVSDIKMVLQMLKNYSVVSVFFGLKEH